MALNIENCIKQLYSSKTDEERLAGILIVTRACPAEQWTVADRRQLLEALDMHFILRLINTKPDSDGGQEFSHLGVSIVHFFCTDPTLAADPRFQDFLGQLSSILITTQSVVTRKEALQCMTSIVQYSPVNADLSKVVHSLCNVILQDIKDVWSEAWHLLLFLTTRPAHLWSDSQLPNELMWRIFKELERRQDQSKFELGGQLSCILLSFPSQIKYTKQFGDKFPEFLFLLLKNKLGPQQRQPLFQLAAAVLTQFGCGPVLLPSNHDSPGHCLLLLLGLATVEITILLDFESIEKIISDLETLTPCLAIVEKILDHVCSDENEDKDYLPKILEKLPAIFESIIDFLNNVHSNYPDQNLQPWVLRPLKTLCAWLAQDVDLLQERVLSVVPYFVSTCQSCRSDIKQRWPSRTATDNPTGNSAGLPEEAANINLHRDTDLRINSILQRLQNFSLAYQGEAVHSLEELADGVRSPAANRDDVADVLEAMLPAFYNLSQSAGIRASLIKAGSVELISARLADLFHLMITCSDALDQSEADMATCCGILLNLLSGDTWHSRPIAPDLLQFTKSALVDWDAFKHSDYTSLPYAFLSISLLIMARTDAVQDDDTDERFWMRAVDLLSVFLRGTQNTDDVISITDFAFAALSRLLETSPSSIVLLTRANFPAVLKEAVRPENGKRHNPDTLVFLRRISQQLNNTT